MKIMGMDEEYYNFDVIYVGIVQIENDQTYVYMMRRALCEFGSVDGFFSIDRQLDGREEFLGSRLRIELERPISNDGELHDGDWVIFFADYLKGMNEFCQRHGSDLFLNDAESAYYLGKLDDASVRDIISDWVIEETNDCCNEGDIKNITKLICKQKEKFREMGYGFIGEDMFFLNQIVVDKIYEFVNNRLETSFEEIEVVEYLGIVNFEKGRIYVEIFERIDGNFFGEVNGSISLRRKYLGKNCKIELETPISGNSDLNNGDWVIFKATDYLYEENNRRDGNIFLDQREAYYHLLKANGKTIDGLLLKNGLKDENSRFENESYDEFSRAEKKQIMESGINKIIKLLEHYGKNIWKLDDCKSFIANQMENFDKLLLKLKRPTVNDLKAEKVRIKSNQSKETREDDLFDLTFPMEYEELRTYDAEGWVPDDERLYVDLCIKMIFDILYSKGYKKIIRNDGIGYFDDSINDYPSVQMDFLTQKQQKIIDKKYYFTKLDSFIKESKDDFEQDSEFVFIVGSPYDAINILGDHRITLFYASHNFERCRRMEISACYFDRSFIEKVFLKNLYCRIEVSYNVDQNCEDFNCTLFLQGINDGAKSFFDYCKKKKELLGVINFAADGADFYLEESFDKFLMQF